MSNTIYNSQIINKNIKVNILNVGKNISEILTTSLKNELEGKCINEGFVKPGSIKIINYSSGLIHGDNVVFSTNIQLDICNPVEDIEIKCKVQDITKAGIRAKLDMDLSPLVIFIARDHHNLNEKFQNIKENDIINVNIIGTRFELNDTYISVIGELID